MLRARRFTAAVIGAATALALALGGVVASAPAQAADVPTLTMSGITSNQILSGTVPVTATLTLPSGDWTKWNIWLTATYQNYAYFQCTDGETVCQTTFMWDVSALKAGQYWVRVGASGWDPNGPYDLQLTTTRITAYVQGPLKLGIGSLGVAHKAGEVVPVHIGAQSDTTPRVYPAGATVRITVTPAVGKPTTYTRTLDAKGTVTINPRAVTTFRVTAQLVAGGWWLPQGRTIHKVTVTAPVTCTSSPTKLYAKKVGTTSCTVPYLPAGSKVTPQYFGPHGWANMTSFSTTLAGRFAYRYSFSGAGWSRLRVVIAATAVYGTTTSPSKYIRIY